MIKHILPDLSGDKKVFFDIGDTLLVKNRLYETIFEIVGAETKYSFEEVRVIHRTVKEMTVFPNKTTYEHYLGFNSNFLECLGVFPTDEILQSLYEAIRELPWVPTLTDAELNGLSQKCGIISNWDLSARKHLSQYFTYEFDPIVVSIEVGYSKPDERIFTSALDQAGVKAAESIMVGDSFHLDILPAKKLGMGVIHV